MTNLQVIAATETSVTISWDPESAIAGPVTYSAWLQHVSHSPRGSGVTITYSQIGTSTTNTSLTISGLTPNQSQTYYLKAVGSGGTSPYAPITATTEGPQPPINFRMTGLTSTTISLAWDPNPGPVPSASYEIWGWYDLYYTVYGMGITNTSFTMTGLTPGTSYQWEIRSHDALGYASAFNIGFTMVNPIPAPATIGTGQVTSGGSFQLTITEGSQSLETVLIEASTNPADTNSWVQIGTIFPTSNPFTFTDTNASQYPTRFYRVIAP
jgi:chitinase